MAAGGTDGCWWGAGELFPVDASGGPDCGGVAFGRDSLLPFLVAMVSLEPFEATELSLRP